MDNLQNKIKNILNEETLTDVDKKTKDKEILTEQVKKILYDDKDN